MKALPGKQRPQWLLVAGQLAAGAVVVSLVLSALPALLFSALVMGLLLIPVLRQLRKEAKRAGIDLDAPAREQMIDVTPLHRRVERDFWAFRKRWR